MPKVNTLAIIILLVFLILLVGSVWNDSATMDELAHIPAGFGYVKEKDFRLNPEHPPLIKTLAALSAKLFVGANFPTNTAAWNEDINGQWTQGAILLYESGNNADRLIFWARLPIILLSVLFGLILFLWVQSRFGTSTALLTLTFFAFSPTVLAHSRYVTTDLGAAFGFFIGIISFIKFLESPNWKNLLLAGLGFGLAQLLKFSLILLIPTYGILILGWIWVVPRLRPSERVQIFIRYAGQTLLIGLIAIIMISAVYAPLIQNYPPLSKKTDGSNWTKAEITNLLRLPDPQRTDQIKSISTSQMRDTIYLLSSFGGGPDPNNESCNPKSEVSLKRRIRCAAEFTIWTVDKTFLRPLGEYLLGLLMALQRSSGGNTAFFLGEVSAAGSPLYFPMLYLFKETLALHILTLIAILFAAGKIIKSFKKRGRDTNIAEKVRIWIREHFVEFAALVFICIYWLTSVRSPLNIGIRHVLPTFPFIYLLVSQKILEWTKWIEFPNPQNFRMVLKNFFDLHIKIIPKYFVVSFLVIWMVAETISVFPGFLSYYNELAGGSKNGYKIAVDSNYDWGQDIKRLKEFVEENQIQKISVDYFGGGSPRYYLGEKFEPWWSNRGRASGWFAISATFREGAFGTPAPGFIRKPEDSYEWLKPYIPITRVGYSIFVYKLP